MLRITTLSENTAIMGNFLAEWGLSILIETDEVNILLDTGRSISATYNADTLGIDLNKIDKIVLSHSHYDHTGGLHEMLRRIRKEEIYLKKKQNPKNTSKLLKKSHRFRLLCMPLSLCFWVMTPK